MPSKSAKNTTKKTSATKTTAASKRVTTATLSQDLKSLEARLKGADTKNRNAIKSLGIVVNDLKSSTRQSKISQKAALTRGLNQLEIRMETYLQRTADQARADIKADLANVTLAGADRSELETALQTAHTRLDNTEKLQREALARLNRHLAGLATEVEKRLTQEVEARKTETAALDSKITSVDKRVDQIEAETADALDIVGAKVAEFAAVLDKRAQTSDTETAERLADLAQETQSQFKSVQSDVTARLEALEVIAAAWSPPSAQDATVANPYLPANADDPRIDQMDDTIKSLQNELERMHARMAQLQPSVAPSPAHNQVSPPTNVLPMPRRIDEVQENPYAAAVQALGSSKENFAAMNGGSETTPPKKANKVASHIPQEFDPAAFNPVSPPAMAESMASPPEAPAPTLAAPNARAPIAPPIAPPMASPGAFAPLASRFDQTPSMDEPVMTAPQPMTTYADPAYAEDDDMRAERIGGNTPKRAGLPKLPISSQNLRVGALAVGVAVAGLFAAKTFMGDSNPGPVEMAVQDARNIAPVTETDIFNADNQTDIQTTAKTIDSPPPPAEPIGQYAETQVPEFVAGQEDTLDAAVASGNPIAQFQKGLAQLQAGQMEEGARLIRLAANRNQPAAQYRLAKLYETGTGVAKDLVTARELIERAARGGNRIAMHDLGNYHAYGQGGLTPNMNEALNWFTKAAERGVVDSQFNVAFLREGNEGVTIDTDSALFWYYVAARQGDQGAPDRIDILSTQIDAAARADIKARADRFNPKPVDEAANGVFRNVPWARPASNSSLAKSAEILKIKDAQILLTELGYSVGAADGIAGAKTRDAVKSFEAVNGLPETGEITDALLDRLEIAAGA